MNECISANPEGVTYNTDIYRFDNNDNISAMLNRIGNDEECDATDDDQGTEAGNIK